MTMDLAAAIRVETSNQDDVAEAILKEIANYNSAMAGALNEKRLVLSMRDADDKLLGGLVGVTFWNALYVELLWVAESMRGRGIGRALMQRAESEARSRACQVAFLNTFSFQAPGFYEKLGYQAFGQLANVPPGETRTWYAKTLA